VLTGFVTTGLTEFEAGFKTGVSTTAGFVTDATTGFAIGDTIGFATGATILAL